MGALLTLLACDYFDVFHECRESLDSGNVMAGVDLKQGDGRAVDEPDMFYECGSEGYVDLGAETVVKEKLREGFEIGDTYFEDSLDPNLGSLDLVVDDLYSLLENQGHHHHSGEIRCMLRMSQEIGSRVDKAPRLRITTVIWILSSDQGSLLIVISVYPY